MFAVSPFKDTVLNILKTDLNIAVKTDSFYFIYNQLKMKLCIEGLIKITIKLQNNLVIKYHQVCPRLHVAHFAPHLSKMGNINIFFIFAIFLHLFHFMIIGKYQVDYIYYYEFFSSKNICKASMK